MNELPDPQCADCKAFYMEGRDETGTIKGLCRLRPELGELPAKMPYCHLFRVRDAREGKVKAIVPQQAARSRRRSSGDASASTGRAIANLENPVTGDTSGEITMDRDGLKQVLRELLEEETLYGFTEIGARWEGGTMTLTPVEEGLQAKEVPIDTFFHKIVMLRDRLRVLESKINAHDKLAEQDKVELQSYISKCYGTLTTFNVLFKNKADSFKSK